MTEYQVREFCMSDLQQLVPKADPHLYGTFLPGVAYTIWKTAEGEERACMCCGIRRIWASVGEAWAIVSRIHIPGPHALKLVHSLLDAVSLQLDLHVLCAFVPETFAQGRNFASFFGFEEHATIRKFFYPVDGVVYWKSVNREKEDAWQRR